jgi:DNA-binding PadR family transcriptional regulator
MKSIERSMSMSLKHGILGLLTYKSMTGYELMKSFNESLSFFWNAQTSQIYRELDTIEKKGWVVSKIIPQDDKPNKKEFTLTNEGKDELNKWLNGHSPEKSLTIPDDMTMRVLFSAGSNKLGLVKELIDYHNQNEEYFKSLKDIEKQINSENDSSKTSKDKLYWSMAIKRGQINSQANMMWVEQCLKIINGE